MTNEMNRISANFEAVSPEALAHMGDGEIAYAFTKFDSIMGKDILRIQCNKPKSEAQAAREAVLRAAGAARPSDRFAPQALDAKYVLENRASPIRARITTME